MHFLLFDLIQIVNLIFLTFELLTWLFCIVVITLSKDYYSKFTKVYVENFLSYFKIMITLKFNPIYSHTHFIWTVKHFSDTTDRDTRSWYNFQTVHFPKISKEITHEIYSIQFRITFKFSILISIPIILQVQYHTYERGRRIIFIEQRLHTNSRRCYKSNSLY